MLPPATRAWKAIIGTSRFSMSTSCMPLPRVVFSYFGSFIDADCAAAGRLIATAAAIARMRLPVIARPPSTRARPRAG